MTEEKRKVGRPRKDQSKPKNPDCEPASKGFVKCIARKVMQHGHGARPPLASAAVCVAGLLLGFSMIASSYRDEYTNTVLVEIFTIIFVCGINMADYIFGGDLVDSSEAEIQEIQKYQPPECCPPEKKECED